MGPRDIPAECAALLADYERVNRDKYPHVLDEVSGIAEGSGQPAELWSKEAGNLAATA